MKETQPVCGPSLRYGLLRGYLIMLIEYIVRHLCLQLKLSSQETIPKQ